MSLFIKFFLSFLTYSLYGIDFSANITCNLDTKHSLQWIALAPKKGTKFNLDAPWRLTLHEGGSSSFLKTDFGVKDFDRKHSRFPLALKNRKIKGFFTLIYFICSKHTGAGAWCRRFYYKDSLINCK